ncbi:hypothetical protein [Qipengyuania thermophila]|uniref:hypothetical protein n=1 Tax=Qipengyuania thermophila TaxID=2509361 RepID=UPI001F18AF68|nr:hypothetical protein [Qipengyuania thermophila]
MTGMTSIGRSLGTLATALLALLAAPLSAQPQANVAAVESRAGNLHVIHLWTTDPDTLAQQMGSGARPAPRTSLAARRLQRVQQLILFGNCRRDPDGKCWLSARVRITAPDGQPYGEELAFDAWPLGPAPAGNGFALAPGAVAVTIEPGEMLGRYTVELMLTDEISVHTAVSVVHLDISEADGAQPAGPKH